MTTQKPDGGPAHTPLPIHAHTLMDLARTFRESDGTHRLVGVTLARIEALEAGALAVNHHAQLVEAIGNFLAKWGEVENRLNDAVALQYIRSGRQYDGPTISAELDALRAVLASAQPTEG